jgi:(p)ppGpp synthase/HD superfamily hydrolase
MSDLNKAIEIATRAHAGQMDMSGQPYILHPLRVMLRLTNPVARMVAVLHDVIEDTHVTEADIKRAGFSSEVMAALRLVTHDKKSIGYLEYVQRIRDSKNTIAVQVKIADLLDNTDPARLKHLKPKVRDSMQKRHLAALGLLKRKH